MISQQNSEPFPAYAIRQTGGVFKNQHAILICPVKAPMPDEMENVIGALEQLFAQFLECRRRKSGEFDQTCFR